MHAAGQTFFSTELHLAIGMRRTVHRCHETSDDESGATVVSRKEYVKYMYVRYVRYVRAMSGWDPGHHTCHP